MPYWDNLGRKFIMEDTEDSADDITWKLNEAGIDATVSFHEETGQYMITVPKDQEEQAWKFLTDMWLEEDKRQKTDPDDFYRKNYLKSSPNFIPSEEKFRYSTNSSLLFLIAGIVVMVMAIFHFFLVLTQHHSDSLYECFLEMILGFVFACFGFNTHQKVRMLESRMEEENSFTNQIVSWCTTIYSAEHIDKCIDAASDNQDISEEERFFLRRQLIQNYILREYDIQDTAYLDFITDLIYKKFYYPNAVSAS